jgi:DNA repair photolyase
MTVKSPVASSPPGSPASRTRTKSKAKKASQQYTKENLDRLSAIEISQAAEELRVANKMFGETSAPQAVQVIEPEKVQDDEDPLVKPTASDTNATENTVSIDVPVSVQDNETEIVQDIEDPLVEQTTSDTNATEGTVPTGVPVVVKNKKVKQDPVDEELVQNAFERLKDIFKQHFHNAMVEAGRYIIDTFYGGDPMAALAKNKTREQPQNLKALVRKISGAPSVNDDGAPSLGWFYNAVNLAAHEAICLREGLQAFATLGHSHKLLLLHVPKLKQIEGDKFDEAIKPAFQVKERLALVAVEKDLSVREFAAHIKTEFPDENTGIDLTLLPPREKLRLLSPDDLRRLFNLAMNKVDESQKAVLTYGKALHEFGIVLAEKNEKDVLGKGHFQDWTKSKNNFNICTGCKNDCLYCYMKPFNAKYPKLKQPADWHNWEIRTEDVEKAYGLKDGWVGFPSSHDIFPEILDAYLTVLGKLLRAGNQVLIVSKPRIDCIKPICEASHFFKDKIIFRFTIGAMDDGILGFWEPNAPGYQERRDCLEFAYDQGFRTSVSMEPMLDTPRIDEQIADLRQFVRKDENIWLGTMNYMNYLEQIKEGVGEELTAAITKVEAGQTVEMLTAIYQKYKDDPLIKWKTDALKKIIGKQNSIDNDRTQPDPKDEPKIKRFGGKLA